MFSTCRISLLAVLECWITYLPILSTFHFSERINWDSGWFRLAAAYPASLTNTLPSTSYLFKDMSFDRWKTKVVEDIDAKVVKDRFSNHQPTKINTEFYIKGMIYIGSFTKLD